MRSEFDENFVLRERFTVRPRAGRRFALDEKPQCFADHLAGVVVEARGDLAPDIFLKLNGKRNVHGVSIHGGPIAYFSKACYAIGRLGLKPRPSNVSVQ